MLGDIRLMLFIKLNMYPFAYQKWNLSIYIKGTKTASFKTTLKLLKNSVGFIANKNYLKLYYLLPKAKQTCLEVDMRASRKLSIFSSVNLLVSPDNEITPISSRSRPKIGTVIPAISGSRSPWLM